MMKSKLPAMILLIALIIAVSCSSGNRANREGRRITDYTGRTVTIPDTVHSVIALKSGTMRLLAYMGVTGMVSHIEGIEQRRNVPYLFANPHLRSLPVIGAGKHYDAELLAAAGSDLIIATFMSPQEADRLQRLTGKPVILLDYGDLGERRDALYFTITLLGDIFRLPERADSIISYFENTIDECAFRASRAAEPQRTAYVGGVAYNGAHGLTSTEPDYPPFNMLAINNVADEPQLKNDKSEPGHVVIFIDPEQLIEWDPDVIFLDAAGRQIWQEELTTGIMSNSLSAFRSGEVYTVLPYNWNTTNYENILCNVWYIGSTLMPSAFGDADIVEKCREIYSFFYGTDIYDKVYEYYRPFERLGVTVQE
ncbi:MAG: ABC transporter substrate-binding protein [Bacteroidales bacterium]